MELYPGLSLLAKFLLYQWYHQPNNNGEQVPVGQKAGILGHATHKKTLKLVHQTPEIVSKCQSAHKGAKDSCLPDVSGKGEIKRNIHLIICS